MKKIEFIQLLDSLKIPVAEGINKDKDRNVFPRIVFWEYVWDFPQASSKNYNNTVVVTYQVSFFSRQPRDPKLIELIKLLQKKKVSPQVNHEYIQDDKYFHSFFSVDLLENEFIQ